MFAGENLRVYRPAYFAGVMATGIVGLALREAGFEAISWVLAGIAAAAYVVLVLLHLRVRWGPPASRASAIELFAFVAATEVLASLSRWHGVAVALWGVGFVAWAVVVRVALAAPARPDEPVRGAWLLATVGTDSLAVTGASLAHRTAGDVLLALSLVLWLLALAVYCVLAANIVGRMRRREIGIHDLHGDHWITMGALAISTLAGMRVTAGMTLLGWPGTLHDIANALSVAIWIAAACWLPALLIAESWRLRQRPLYTANRWGTVFPLGMYAVASYAINRTAHVGAGTTIAHIFTAAGAAAWLATATGFLIPNSRFLIPSASGPTRGRPRAHERTSRSRPRTPRAAGNEVPPDPGSR
ncbi:MAG TPA: tellurite resistance/C4-dicarboxylate transporter family protein [Thermoleophilaceae bacterium]|nr:tellurite resistance/C4-dicarboxylate transporter family protein [Thermoleophilaceae bacterium]